MIRTWLRKKIVRRRPVIVDLATGPDQRWCMDFVHERREDGRKSNFAGGAKKQGGSSTHDNAQKTPSVAGEQRTSADIGGGTGITFC